MRCNVDPNFVQQSLMKGIIEEKRVKWSDYAPIMVDQLPFYIRAEVGSPVSRPFCMDGITDRALSRSG